MTHEKETSDLLGQRKQRIEKVEEIRKLGIDPYPSKSERTHHAKQILDNYDNLQNEEVTVAGRLMSWRSHGQLAFAELQDQSGKIQLYIRQDQVKPTNAKNGNIGFDDFRLFDIGDIVEAKGIVTKTQSGETSVMPSEIKILTKTIRPLPNSWEGMKDTEERFRRRYLDMTMDPSVRQRFERRSIFWDAIREFLNANGFVEVNIPVLETVTGGADAKPFETYYDALDQTFYLRISHELPLKRLLGGGFEKVYDLGPRFRNEGFSDEHLPEHVAMEWYWAYADYKDGMRFTTDMYRFVMKKVYGTLQFNMKGFEVDLAKDWVTIDFSSVIKDRFGVDIFSATVEEMNAILKENGVDLGEDINKNRVVDNLWKLIRKTIAGPAFLTGVPKFLSPLAKTNKENPLLTDRFHPVIAGSELANAFSELNDPQDQLDRFLEQQGLRDAGDAEAHMLDIDFVEMLEYGMPPAVGFGLSERVFWFFENVSAKEGVPFPQLKHKIDDITKKIYPMIDFSEKKEEKKIEGISAAFENVNVPSIEFSMTKLEENVDNEYHLLHAKMIGAGMRAYAEKLGGNPLFWYTTGLLHDIDYTKYPDQHPHKSIEWFKEWGYPEELQQAVLAHDHRSTEVKPKSTLDRALVAVDEISGLLYAYSAMRPEKFKGMKVDSVMKKFKDKNFAPNLHRDEIKQDVAFLKIELEKHIEFLINVFNQMIEFGGEKDYSKFDAQSSKSSTQSKTQDFDNRIAIVINKDLENWQIANTISHISAYLGHKLDEKFGTGENFVTKDGKNHPRNSQYAIVILAANPGQMANFMQKVRESGLLYHGFIKEMIETTNDNEITEILAEKSDAEIEYLGVGIFGDNETLRKLTSKFSLYR